MNDNINSKKCLGTRNVTGNLFDLQVTSEFVETMNALNEVYFLQNPAMLK